MSPFGTVSTSHQEDTDPVVVSGHKNRIKRGPRTSSGFSTVVKETTGWEALMYLSMVLQTDSAICALAAFSPSFVAIKRCGETSACDWVFVENTESRSMLEMFYDELRKTAAETNSYNEVMDATQWAVCLVDVTDSMRLPCVADIKIGHIRHSPYTPLAKLKRLLDKRVVQPLAIRFCGALHYFYRTLSNEKYLEKEECNKDIGYVLNTEEEYRQLLCAFLSSTVGINAENGVSVCRDNERVAARLHNCSKEVAKIFAFFASPLGCRLLERTAFLSTSLLFVYDAANSADGESEVDKVWIYLIDYGRTSDRRLNYPEETVGFLHGLRRLVSILS